MQKQVLKKDEKLENVEQEEAKKLALQTAWQRKTYPLKLNLTPIQREYLDMMILEYKKAINKAIQIIREKVFANFEKIKDGEIKKEKCPLCKGTKNLNYVMHNFQIYEYKIGDKEVNKVLPRKGVSINVCNCFLGQSSTPHKIIRKFVMPSSNRDILPEYDFTVFGSLYHKDFTAGKGARPSIYDSCLQKAMEAIKSQIKLNERIEYRISFFRDRIEGKKDYLNSLIDGKITDKNLEKYSIKDIRRFIQADKRKIAKLEKRKASTIVYKQNAIRLYDNAYKLVKDNGEFFIELKNPQTNMWLKLHFYGREYQKKLAEKLILIPNCETEILRRNGDYYLQYILRQEMKIPVPDKTFSDVKIKIELNKIIIETFKGKKRKSVKFYNLKQMWRKRRQMDKIRKILQKRKRLKKVKLSRTKEIKFVNYFLHNVSTEIIHDIKTKIKKPVIKIENMKYVRDKLTSDIKRLKKEKPPLKVIRKMNWKINRWNFNQFQNMIQYKANWVGIPVLKE